MNQGKLLEVAIALANRQVEHGQQATQFMAQPVVAEFFEDAAREYVEAMERVDPGDHKAIRDLIYRHRAIRDLYHHLTSAVTAGLTAARSLSEQAEKEK